jgi:hypothetical protein
MKALVTDRVREFAAEVEKADGPAEFAQQHVASSHSALTVSA